MYGVPCTSDTAFYLHQQYLSHFIVVVATQAN